MHKSNPLFGGLRQDVVRKAVEVISNSVQRVDHDSLGCARMSAFALERHRGGAGTPRFVADLAQSFAVNRIGQRGTKGFHVEFFYSATNFFIGSERYGDRAMLKLRVLSQRVDHRHDLSNP